VLFGGCGVVEVGEGGVADDEGDEDDEDSGDDGTVTMGDGDG